MKTGGTVMAVVGVFIAIMILNLLFWAAVVHWAIIPLVETFSDYDLTFWPTYIVTILITSAVSLIFRK